MNSLEEEPTILLLPSFLTTVWSKIEPDLIKIGKGAGPENMLDFIEILYRFISLHYHKNKTPYNLKILVRVFETFDKSEIHYFLKVFLPSLAKIALSIDTLFPQSVKLMKQNKESSIQLTKKQVVCLISHMFLCTFHEQKNPKLPKARNFIYLYHEDDYSRISLKINKILGFYSYLKRNLKKMPETGSVIYQRILFDPKIHQSYLTTESWHKSKNPLSPIFFHELELIEDSKNCIQTIFCNKRLGGGVLENGGLQEEMRFVRNPEMLPALLIVEELEDYEAFYYHGCEDYNLTSGYAEKMILEGDLIDNTEIDIFDKKDHCFASIDAFQFKEKNEQYTLNMILRELNKAFLGFFGSDLVSEVNERKGIATGKWGCGDFKGDFELKFLIQWIAASETQRPIHFYFLEKENLEKYNGIIKKFKDYKVGEIFNCLTDFSKMINEQNMQIGVFEFMTDFVD